MRLPLPVLLVIGACAAKAPADTGPDSSPDSSPDPSQDSSTDTSPDTASEPTDTAEPIAPTPLADAPAHIDGAPGAQDLLGYDLAACDLDEDGVDDLLVTAPFGAGYAGQIGIWYGRPDWPATLSMADADTLVTSTTWFLGFGLACADVDGDGHLDLVTTRGELAPSESHPSEFAVLVWYGTGHGWGAALPDTDAVALALPLGVLPAVGDVYSLAVQALDLDDDGAAELIVPLPVSDGYTAGDNTIRVLPGARYPADTSFDAQPDQVRLAADVPFAGLTASPGGLLLRAPDASDDAGHHPGSLSALHWDPTAPTLSALVGATITGVDDQRLGAALAIGDFDGDGSSDGALVAIGDTTGGGGSGALLGLPGLGEGLVGGPASALRTGRVTGSTTNAALGLALASTGDVDGDGSDDIVATEPGANGGAGRIWLLSGARVMATGTRSSAQAAIGGWEGEDHNNGTGTSLAVGDLDGDGLVDVATADPLWLTAGEYGIPTASGRAYLLFGGR